MKKAIFLPLAVSFMVLILNACGQRPQPTPHDEAISIFDSIPGDSTYYGLACDGSTDSMLILLPYSGNKLDTFDILDARMEHHIYGRPRIGDLLAVIADPDTTGVARMVIDMNVLQKEWSYLAYPTLRTRPDGQTRPIPDSILQRIMAPREYSLRLRRGGMAFTKGGVPQQSSDDRRPVDFPDSKRYSQWHLFNGKLILATDSTHGMQTDTATIVLLRRDSLVLRFSDHEQGYYNKEARDSMLRQNTNNK